VLHFVSNLNYNTCVCLLNYVTKFTAWKYDAAVEMLLYPCVSSRPEHQLQHAARRNNDALVTSEEEQRDASRTYVDAARKLCVDSSSTAKKKRLLIDRSGVVYVHSHTLWRSDLSSCGCRPVDPVCSTHVTKEKVSSAESKNAQITAVVSRSCWTHPCSSILTVKFDIHKRVCT
jgi:hypothetical protein